MLAAIESAYVLADVFIFVALAILLVFGFGGLRWPKSPRPNAHRADPH